jgi:hypothetical protein
LGVSAVEAEIGYWACNCVIQLREVFQGGIVGYAPTYFTLAKGGVYLIILPLDVSEFHYYGNTGKLF